MDKSEIIKLIDERLKLCGIQIPIEETFDYTGVGMVDKCKLFVKLVQGDWRKAIYVRKKNDKPWLSDDYYDLLFAVDEDGAPICIPVPVARKLWNISSINANECRSCMTGSVYEDIYRKYYEQAKFPF